MFLRHVLLSLTRFSSLPVLSLNWKRKAWKGPFPKIGLESDDLFTGFSFVFESRYLFFSCDVALLLQSSWYYLKKVFRAKSMWREYSIYSSRRRTRFVKRSKMYRLLHVYSLYRNNFGRKSWSRNDEKTGSTKTPKTRIDLLNITYEVESMKHEEYDEEAPFEGRDDRTESPELLLSWVCIASEWPPFGRTCTATWAAFANSYGVTTHE